MVQVTFEIPDHLVGLAYIEVGAVLRRFAEDDAPDGEEEGEPADWGTQPDDAPVAESVWRKFSPRAQAVFSLLMDSPGVAISADDIASKIGLSNGRHGLAGIVAWPSRQCAEVGRAAPFRYDNPASPRETGSYWMDVDTAAVFLAAREAYRAKLGQQPGR